MPNDEQGVSDIIPVSIETGHTQEADSSESSNNLTICKDSMIEPFPFRTSRINEFDDNDAPFIYLLIQNQP